MTVSALSLRPWATSPEVSRGFRALLAGRAPDAPPAALVVLLGASIPPESIPSAAWRSVEGRPVAAVDLETARALAAGRSASAARELSGRAPARCVWVVALAADGSALTWPSPVAFLRTPPVVAVLGAVAQPPPASTPSPAEVAAEEKRARLAAYARGAQLPLWSPGGDA